MNIQKAVLIYNSYQYSSTQKSILGKIDTRSFLIVTIAYLVALLSLPLHRFDQILWFAIYPIVMAPLLDLSYSSIFKRSLYVLPFIILIGIFNPIVDNHAFLIIGETKISMGWIIFLSLSTRGLLAMQGLLILISFSGFIDICNSLRRLGCPEILTLQLWMIYRYLGTLMEEGIIMKRTMESRGFGKKSFPISLWSRMIGSLLINTIERAKRIHKAMISRGFDGHIHFGRKSEWNYKDSLFCLVWTGVFLFLHFFNLSNLFINHF